MKKILLILILSSYLFSQGEVHKGQTYYYYLLKESLGYDGAIFAKKHTDKEWEKLFSNQAEDFKKDLLIQNDNLKQFVNSE